MNTYVKILKNFTKDINKITAINHLESNRIFTAINIQIAKLSIRESARLECSRNTVGADFREAELAQEVVEQIGVHVPAIHTAAQDLNEFQQQSTKY